MDIEALPAPKVTWLKDGVVLDDNAAELTPTIQVISETRLGTSYTRDMT